MYQELYNKAKNVIRQDTCMKFYDALKPLYLETDTSSIGLGVGLSQVRKGMNCRWEKVPDNTALFPTKFTSKTLSITEWWYSNIVWEDLGITTWSGEIWPSLLCQGSKHNNRSQTIGGNAQQGCHNPVTAAAATMHNAVHSPIQCAHII